MMFRTRKMKEERRRRCPRFSPFVLAVCADAARRAEMNEVMDDMSHP